MTPTVGKGLYIVKRNGKFVKVIKKTNTYLTYNIKTGSALFAEPVFLLLDIVIVWVCFVFQIYIYIFAKRSYEKSVIYWK